MFIGFGFKNYPNQLKTIFLVLYRKIENIKKLSFWLTNYDLKRVGVGGFYANLKVNDYWVNIVAPPQSILLCFFQGKAYMPLTHLILVTVVFIAILEKNKALVFFFLGKFAGHSLGTLVAVRKDGIFLISYVFFQQFFFPR